MPYRDDDNDELDEREYPEPSNEDDQDIISCPRCRASIYEEAEQCPRCGYYILDEEQDHSQKPLWLVVGVVLLLMMIILFWVLG